MVEKWWFSDPSSPSTMTYQLLALYCKQGLFLIFLSSIFIFLLSSFYYLPYLFIIDTQKFDNSLLYYQRRGIWKCNYFWFFFFHDQLFQIFTPFQSSIPPPTPRLSGFSVPQGHWGHQLWMTPFPFSHFAHKNVFTSTAVLVHLCQFTVDEVAFFTIKAKCFIHGYFSCLCSLSLLKLSCIEFD